MQRRLTSLCLVFGMLLILARFAEGENRKIFSDAETVIKEDSLHERKNAAGVNFLLSNGGLGLGGFFRYKLDKDLYAFVDLSLYESKDDEDVEYIDYWTGQKFSPGKIKRFLVSPLYFGIQYRLFREAIEDNFRPYLTASAGPSIVFAAPVIEEVKIGDPPVTVSREIDFFKSLERGQAHYTFSIFIGAGIFWGSVNAPIGLSCRYSFVPVFGGLPSRYGFGKEKKKSDFGGFFLVITVGGAF